MKKILFAMIEAGGGHKSPAVAVAYSLDKNFPDKYDVNIQDFCRAVGAYEIDQTHKDSWKRSLKNPRLTRIVYWFVDIFGGFSRFLVKTIFSDFYEKAIDWIRLNKPDIVFSTHFVNAWASILAKKKGLVHQTILLVTDPHAVSSLWIWKDIDYLLVCSERARDEAVKRRFPEEKIRVVPYPVHPKFLDLKNNNKKTVLPLDRDKKTILITAGGQGLSRIEDLVLKIEQEGLRINLLVVCGRNEELHKRLSELQANNQTTIDSFGFVDNMNEMIDCSDIVVTKAGAASTYEALLMKKPILFFDYVAYNEYANIEFVLRNGLGWFARNNKEIIGIIKKFINDTHKLEEIQKRFNTMDFRNGAYPIARFVDECANARIETKADGEI